MNLTLSYHAKLWISTEAMMCARGCAMSIFISKEYHFHPSVYFNKESSHYAVTCFIFVQRRDTRRSNYSEVISRFPD